MGLKDTFQKAAQTAFTAAGDVVEDGWYYSLVSTRYDVSAGYVSAYQNQYLISAIFTQFKKEKIDNEKILPTDLLMLIPQRNMTPHPKPNDVVQRLEQETSVVYEVIDYQQDPAGALYKIQLRKP